jgi:hypothetical protein
MINFYLFQFMFARQFLRQQVDQVNGEVALRPHEVVPQKRRRRVECQIRKAIEDCANKLEITDAVNAGIELENLFGNYEFQPYTWNQLHVLLDRLRAAIDLGITAECFFHYGREDARLVGGIDKEWAKVFSAFPSTQPEITAAIDCYAIGHNTACVFHMMRAAEFGLRMIARERGIRRVGRNKPIEWGTWQDVFQAVEDKLRAVRQAAPGPKKDTALAFYNGAASDLRTLQSNYRDPTMHFRDSYDRGQAYSAMFRVKSLMETLATKLREDRIRKIRWGL